MPLPLVSSLDRDWFGEQTPRCAFSLELISGELVFSARVAKPAFLIAGDAGGFHEGLWDGDCAELFLKNPANGHYLEFNLSPRGGHWSCAFTGPRVRVPGGAKPIPGMSGTGIIEGDVWSATLRLPVAGLPPELAFDPKVTRGNVTFCLGNAPQRYLTLADLGGGTPNFHLPERWIPLFA